MISKREMLNMSIFLISPTSNNLTYARGRSRFDWCDVYPVSSSAEGGPRWEYLQHKGSHEDVESQCKAGVVPVTAHEVPNFPATAAATSARYSFSWVLKAPHIFPLPPLSRRFHSTHILDITPGKVVDGLSHLHESLDNVRDAPMRRVPPAPLHSEWEASRARSEIAQELVLQEDILIALNKFNDRQYTARDQGFTRPRSTNPSQHPPRLSEHEQSGRQF